MVNKASCITVTLRSSGDETTWCCAFVQPQQPMTRQRRMRSLSIKTTAWRRLEDRDRYASRRRSAPVAYSSARCAIRVESTSSTSSRGARSASRHPSTSCSTGTRRAWTRRSTGAFEPSVRRRLSCPTSGCRTRAGTSVRCCSWTAATTSASTEHGSTLLSTVHWLVCMNTQTDSLQFLFTLFPHLTLWRPLLPYGYSYKASCARPGQAVICNFWHPGTLTLSPERHSARISKISNDGLTRSGTGCFTAVTIW